MNTDVRYDRQLTEKVIGAAIEVSNNLGAGFLEKVYERALLVELRGRGVAVTSQPKLAVSYKGTVIATYVADLLVEDALLVELKCVESLRNEHTSQCLNYLRASNLGLCLLVNFQRPRLEWKRIAL